MTQTLAFANDHAGYLLKDFLIEEARSLGFETVDLGTNSADSVDYPDFGFAVAEALKSGKASLGVLICGTGIGIGIAANRYAWVRAATCHDVTSARLAREHNDANVLSLGERLVGPEVAKEMVRVFLTTDFSGGERHMRRVGKLSDPQKLD